VVLRRRVADARGLGNRATGSSCESRKRRKGVDVKLSARNKLVGTVTSITRGEAIANVALDVAGQKLIASITVQAVNELGLQEGMAVTAIVKASDVILATED
jgi:molybdopterin-binding protein